MSAMRVAVVVLDYNGAEETLACVRSVLGSLHPAVEVLVVDNGSDARSVEALRAGLVPVTGHEPEEGELGPDLPPGSRAARHGPRVTFLGLPRNLGYTGGNNVGLRRALALGCDAALLLNNDVVVPPDAIGRLVEALEADAGLGIVGALNVDPADGKTVVEAGVRMDLVWLDAHLVPPRTHGVERVDKVMGSAMLVRSAVLREVGLLDERYFLYWEDTDFCFRARARGHGVAVSYDARVLHGPHGTSNPRVRAYFMNRNALLFLSSHLPLHRRLLPQALLVARGVKDVLKHALGGAGIEVSRAIADGLVDGLTGRTGKGRLDRHYGRGGSPPAAGAATRARTID